MVFLWPEQHLPDVVGVHYVEGCLLPDPSTKAADRCHVYSEDGIVAVNFLWQGSQMRPDAVFVLRRGDRALQRQANPRRGQMTTRKQCVPLHYLLEE